MVLQKLLQKGDQHTRQSSADSSGCSSGQESVTSSLTSDSQVSNDSGTEVDPIVSTKKLIINATADSLTTTTASPVAWESSSLRQRNVAGVSKPAANLETSRWVDPYIKVTKGSNELVTTSTAHSQSIDASSLARSTPNLNENVDFTTPKQTWSSVGYLSMLSSTEEISNDLTTVPKEITNLGSYSVVGALTKTENYGDELKEDLKIKPTTNPYVTLASIEQKSKEHAEKKILDSMQVFKDIGYDASKQLQADKQQLPGSFLQTSFLNFKKPFESKTPPTSVILSTQQLQQPSSFCAQTFLAEELSNKLSNKNVTVTPPDSKPYVKVATIPNTAIRKPDVVPSSFSISMHKPYVTVSQLPLSNMTTVSETIMELGNVKDSEINSFANSSVLQMLQKPTTPTTVEALFDESQEKIRYQTNIH